MKTARAGPGGIYEYLGVLGSDDNNTAKWKRRSEKNTTGKKD